MDFKAMLKPMAFGTRPADDVPKPFVRRQSQSRRLAALREAGDVLTVLPGPGESLHAIMTGRYDLCDLLEVILAKLGTVAQLRIATLSFNGRNAQTMTAWTEGRKVERLSLLCSVFFKEHNPELFEQLHQALAKPHRMAASRNHCKLVCFHFATGDKLVMEGSANLRTNSNREQFCLVRDDGLHDWHAAWIDEEVLKHESDQSRNPAKG
jgi:hypothetical protein